MLRYGVQRQGHRDWGTEGGKRAVRISAELRCDMNLCKTKLRSSLGKVVVEMGTVPLH